MSRNTHRSLLEDTSNSSDSSQAFYDDNVAQLRVVLRKFRKDQLLTVVFEACNLSESVSVSTHFRKLSKGKIIDHFIASMVESQYDLSEVICAVELKWQQINSSKRIWNALYIKEPGIFVKDTTSPERFAKKLWKYLSRSHLYCKAKSSFHDGALWTIILVYNKGNKPDKMFFVMYSDLPLIIHSTVKAAYKPIISRCVMQLFKGNDVDVLPLCSKHIKTLLSYSNDHFKLEATEDRIVQRPARVSPVEEEPLVENIVNLEEEEDRETNLYISEVFGSLEEDPLEMISFNVFSDFEIDDEVSVPDVSSHVVFKGENVLEGLRKFVKMGAAIHPLPDFLTHAGTQEYGNQLTLNMKYHQTNES